MKVAYKKFLNFQMYDVVAIMLACPHLLLLNVLYTNILHEY